MFSSVSSCTPNSQVSTEFVATSYALLDIWANVSVAVNGNTKTARPIELFAGDRVTATVTTPSANLAYRFYPYTINDLTQSFAVVNQNNYNPTVKTVAKQRRWYNYIEKEIRVSFYDTPNRTSFPLGTNRNYVDIDSLHIVLDPLKYAVLFYSQGHDLISSIKLAGGPIEYKKIPAETITSTYTQDLLVLCNNGIIYRIKFDNFANQSDKFEPYVLTIPQLDNLPYNEDIPGVGSFTDAVRRDFLRALFPAVKTLDYNANTIWIAGGDLVYLTNRNFALISTINIVEEDVVNLACMGSNAAIAVTKSNKVFKILASGSASEIYSASVLGAPGTLPDGLRVAVPDPENYRLLIFDSTGNYQVWATPNFSPAYARTFGDKLWVTGHDTNRVFAFTNAGVGSYIDFNYKTALISVVGDSYLAVHALRNYTTLNLSGIQKIIPFELGSRSGGLTHVGTRPVQVTMLGQESLPVVAGPRLTVWINGALNQTLNSGDYLGVSFKGDSNGKFRSQIIIGENAIDYTVQVSSSRTLKDYFLGGVVANRRLGNIYGEFTPIDIGNTNDGYTGPFPLNFSFVLYNNIYTEFTVGTNGYITFGNNFIINSAPTIGSLGVDALYPYPKDLLQGYPIDNTDPLNIKPGRLDSALVPGLFYKYESLGAFLGIRLRWVGTTMDSYPFGNIKNTKSVTTTNSNLVPLYDTLNYNIGDYVSGNGITSSTQVIDKIVKNQNFTAYYFTSNTMRVVESLSNVLPYSDVMDVSTGTLYGYSNAVSSFFHQGNAIIAKQGSTYTLTGHEPAEVNTGVVFEFQDPEVAVIGANSITRTTGNITSLGSIYPDNRYGTSLFYVSEQDYNTILLNERLFAPESNANLLVTTSGIVTDKDIYITQFTLTANSIQKAEGRVIRFELLANIAYYWQDTYTWTITGDVDVNDFAAYRPKNSNWANVTSLSGNIKLYDTYNPPGLYSGYVDFLIRADGISEPVESYTFTVSNLSNYNYSLSVSSEIKDSGVDSTFIPTDTVTSTEYVLTSSIHPYMWNSNGQATFYRTNITFDGYAGNHTSIDFSFNELTLFQPNVYGFTPMANVQIHANYAVISPPTSITSNTALLFKANITHPTIAYETGIYVGDSFQYVEYFYETVNHDANINVGIARANTNGFAGIVSTTTVANTSVLFGSEVNGVFELVGLGSFTEIYQGFNARHPRLLNIDTSKETELRYDYIVDQTIPGFANIKAALNYGELLINNGEYTGSFNLDRDALVSVVIPFNNNLLATVPLLSFGDYQIGLPAVPGKIYNNYQTTQLLLENQPLVANLSATITVPVAGTYFIPDYYRIVITTAGNDLLFEKIVAGNATVLSKGTYHSFNINDQIRVSRQILSNRKYDTREVVIAGPRFLKVIFKTLGDRLFNNLSYGTLEQPFVRYKQDFDMTVRLPDQTSIPYYRTGNIKLTGNGSVTSRLFVNGVGVNFVVNGNASSNYLPSVTTGANIALEWDVPNYFASNAIIYQVQTDAVDSSNIYIPIGSWNINNRPVGDGLLVDYNTLFGQAALAYLQSPNTHLVADAAVAEYLQNVLWTGRQIQSQYLGSGSYLTSAGITGQYIGAYTVILPEEPIFAEFLGRTPTTISGSIGSRYLGSVLFQSSARISAGMIPFSQTTLLIKRITGEYLSAASSYLIEQITSDVQYPGYTIITTSAVSGELATDNQFSLLGKIPAQEASIKGTVISTAVDFDFIVGDSLFGFEIGNRVVHYAEGFRGNLVNDLVNVEGLRNKFSAKVAVNGTVLSKLFDNLIYNKIYTDNFSKFSPMMVIETVLSGQQSVIKAALDTQITKLLTTEYSKESLVGSIIPVKNQVQSEYIYSQSYNQYMINNELFGETEAQKIQLHTELVDQFDNYYYVPNELTSTTTVELDYNYYLSQQTYFELAQESLLFEPLGHETLRENELSLPFLPVLIVEPILGSELDPLFWQEHITPYGFEPLLFQQPTVNYKFLAELWREPAINIYLEPLAYKPTLFNLELVPNLQAQKLFNGQLQPYLYRDEMWEFDEFDTYGTVSTDQQVYADQGRDGDYWLYQNEPVNTPNRKRGPFIKYDYTKGSALLLSQSKGRVYLEFHGNGAPLTSGNAVIHSNGINYYYDKLKQKSTAIDSYFDPGLSVTLTGNVLTVSGGVNNVANGVFTGNVTVTDNRYYGPGSYRTYQSALAMAGKYAGGRAVQIIGTDYWNYRVYFRNRMVCTNRRSIVFPKIWYIRGG